MIENGMLIEKLLHGAEVIVLLFERDVDALIVRIIIMVKLDAELRGR